MSMSKSSALKPARYFLKKAKRIWAVSILLTITLGALVITAVCAEGVIKTVPLGGHQLNTLAYDSGKGEIFVSDQVNGISIISDSTNAVIATVTDTPTNINGMAYDSGKNEIFVTSRATNNVSIISDNTNTVVANVTGATSLSLNGVAYDSRKGEIFVTNYYYNTISVISDSNNTVIGTVNVGDGPYGVTYDLSKGKIFVTNYTSGTVSVISDSIQSTEFHYLGDITINADGTVNPPSAPIQKSGDTYILASDVDGSITVEKSNILFNGNGFTVNGILSIGNWGSNNNPATPGLAFASNITVENFTVTGSSFGIQLFFMSNATVANNTVTGTGNGYLSLDEPTAGIDVEGGGSNAITGNIIENNYCGISFLETINNLIVGNNISDNHNPVLGGGVGVMLWGASNNTIYHNNFISNPEQAGEASFNSPSSGNVWDDGFPGGGNYWSGYNAAEIDSTGIGDKPYVIDSQNKDRYPLMAPFGTSFMLNYLQEIAPPKISVLSPLNRTYSNRSVPLIFELDKAVNWEGYSLDGEQNVTVSGNSTLATLTYGRHTVTVYANSTFGFTGTSDTVSFTIAKPFPTVTVAAVSGAVAAVVVVAGLLVYFRKRKH